jgi:hypothetical protein
MLVKTGTGGEEQWVAVMQISRPDDLGDRANLGLTMAERKLVLAGLQRQFVAGQAGNHAVVCRPDGYLTGQSEQIVSATKAGLAWTDAAAPHQTPHTRIPHAGAARRDAPRSRPGCEKTTNGDVRR